MKNTGSCSTGTVLWQLIAFSFLSLSQNRLSVTGICSLLKSVKTCQRVVEVQVRYVALESSLGLIPEFWELHSEVFVLSAQECGG